MAVIKSFDLIYGHVFDTYQPEVTVAQAIDLIKARRESGRAAASNEIDFIGQRGVVEVEPDKLKCPSCKEYLSFRLDRGRRL